MRICTDVETCPLHIWRDTPTLFFFFYKSWLAVCKQQFNEAKRIYFGLTGLMGLQSSKLARSWQWKDWSYLLNNLPVIIGTSVHAWRLVTTHLSHAQCIIFVTFSLYTFSVPFHCNVVMLGVHRLRQMACIAVALSHCLAGLTKSNATASLNVVYVSNMPYPCEHFV